MIVRGEKMSEDKGFLSDAIEDHEGVLCSIKCRDERREFLKKRGLI